ncbi:uncharacterized protein LOC142232670 [Haematobia irritans]|uniref:uncharacterized protein LOC142232670 n=1 Tax=Haematobia irritans TaxID=7368 RepID=UPI003F5048B4
MDNVVATHPTCTTHASPSATAVAPGSASTSGGISPPPPPLPAAKKSSTTLSVDRAAFLLLRVKKAFKRKRQHRKEKQAGDIAGQALTFWRKYSLNCLLNTSLTQNKKMSPTVKNFSKKVDTLSEVLNNNVNIKMKLIFQVNG